MTKISIPKTAAILVSASALCVSHAFAGDSCCKTSCCETPSTENTYGLTGDWGGFRSTLKENGVEINGSYAGEIFGNPTGGKKHGSVLDGLLKLSLDVNLEKTVGLPDATFRISGLYPHGTSGTLRNVGDASYFSNIDAYDSYRLVDLWVEQKLSDGKIALKLGQMRVDDEFGVTDSAGLFINSTFGVPNPPLTPMALAIYPVGGLGARVRFEPIEGVYGLLGAYDGTPGSAKQHGTDWALRSSEGSLYAGEVGYQRSDCAYPGAIRFGFLYHTADFDDVREGHSESYGSSTSSYYVIDQTVWQKGQGSKEGVSVFLRGTMAEKTTANMSTTSQVGVVYTGLAAGEDKLGLAFARNKFSPGQTDSKSSESITELSYQVPVTSYLRVQPDIQYICKPGGTSQYQNALVIGIRAILDF
jgi:porin